MAMIYFIQSGGPSGPVKIGHAKNVRKRLHMLRVGSCEELSVIGYSEGGKDREEEIHAILSRLHIRGEWFSYSGQIGELISFRGMPPTQRKKRIWNIDMENNVERLAELFGSKAALARVCGINPAMVWRWAKPSTWHSSRAAGRDGHLPPQYNRAVMSAARDLVKDMRGQAAVDFVAQVSACLDPAVCPTCGQSIDDGRVL